MRSLVRPRLPAILALALASSTAAAQGEVVRALTLHSDALSADRRVLVRLPPGYDRGDARYPVLYLTDGSRQLPLLAATVRFLAQQGRIPELILVGIDPVDRNRELTPTRAAGVQGGRELPTSGGADAFLAFVEKELIPFVEKNHRTAPYRILAGHSLGGLFALHTLHARPALFQARIAVSPILEWDRELPIRRTRELLAKAPAPELAGTLVVAIGDEGPQAAAAFERLRAALAAAPPALRWSAIHLPGEDHGTVVFDAHYRALRDIFAGWQMPIADGDVGPRGGLTAVEAHYRALSTRIGMKILPPEAVVNLAAYQLLADGHAEEAIRAFEKNVEWYPRSANVHDSLGDAYARAGRLDDARREYRTAWEVGQKTGDPLTPAYREHFERANAGAGRSGPALLPR